MIKKIKSIFSGYQRAPQYKNMSDFMINAPSSEKAKIFVRAARKANEDQRKMIEESRKKIPVTV